MVIHSHVDASRQNVTKFSARRTESQRRDFIVYGNECGKDAAMKSRAIMHIMAGVGYVYAMNGKMTTMRSETGLLHMDTKMDLHSTALMWTRITRLITVDLLR